MFEAFFGKRVAFSLLACSALPAFAQVESRQEQSAPTVAVALQAPGPLTLASTFSAALARQPELLSQASRLRAADAAQRSAETLTAAPPTAGASLRTDRLGSNAGARELELGVSAPLWLPGEKQRAGRLATAQLDAVGARVSGTRMRVAAAVRDAWWRWQLAELEHQVSTDRLAGARRLNGDVQRRVRAGELSRADQFQAEGAVAQAEVAMADTATARAVARQALLGLLGLSGDVPALEPRGVPANEPLPGATEGVVESSHPALADLSARVEFARREAELVSVQTRANPELAFSAVTERGAVSESSAQSVVIGIRIPFGAASRAEARLAGAVAEAEELQALLALERARVLADIAAARARLEASLQQLDAAERRASLAREVRGFIEKSFQLGESDLPNRLRVELEAGEAERQVVRTRIAIASAVSNLRQSLGLAPE